MFLNKILGTGYPKFNLETTNYSLNLISIFIKKIASNAITQFLQLHQKQFGNYCRWKI